MNSGGRRRQALPLLCLEWPSLIHSACNRQQRCTHPSTSPSWIHEDHVPTIQLYKKSPDVSELQESHRNHIFVCECHILPYIPYLIMKSMECKEVCSI